MSSHFTAGTGYGGNASADGQKLRQGRKQAAKEESKADSETTSYLSRVHASLLQRTPSAATSVLYDEASKEKIVKVLQEVFHNTILTDWGKRHKLYMQALDVCETLARSENSALGQLLYSSLDDGNEENRIEIEESNDETILTCLEGFAALAECVVGPSQSSSVVVDAKDKKLAQRVIQVKNAVAIRVQQCKASCTTKKQAAILSVTTPNDIYKEQLGPLRFNLCQKLPHHYFATKTKASLAPKLARDLFKELTSYKTALPVEYASSILVRALEDRLDLCRVLIMGPDDTPYANGAFIFDVHLPSTYPKTAPTCQFINHGSKRFNPNLYNNGKVCLSLLGTWQGPGWVAGTSSLLQVLVSIQALILVADPFFNEPGYERQLGTPTGKRNSDQYNLQIRKFTLTVSQEPILKALASNKPSSYPEFDEALRRHYVAKRALIQNQWETWAQGDPSLRTTVNRLLGYLDKLTPPAPARAGKKKRPPAVAAINYQVDANGVIDLFHDEVRPVRRAKHNNDEVVVLDDDDEDGKMPATSSEAPLVAAATAPSTGDVVDLT